MNQGKTILLSTHDIDLALLLADRLWLLSRQKGLTGGVTEDVVLSGAMDNFFKGENILFDKNSGNFLPNRESRNKVHLQAEGYLYHWTKNMLERHGFGVGNEENSTLFSIIVDSAVSIRVVRKDGTGQKLHNYEELSNYLSVLQS